MGARVVVVVVVVGLVVVVAAAVPAVAVVSGTAGAAHDIRISPRPVRRHHGAARRAVIGRHGGRAGRVSKAVR
jgi:hypothetical protein